MTQKIIKVRTKDIIHYLSLFAPFDLLQHGPLGVVLLTCCCSCKHVDAVPVRVSHKKIMSAPVRQVGQNRKQGQHYEAVAHNIGEICFISSDSGSTAPLN